MTTQLSIQGMHCGSCKALIEDVVSEIPGVTSCDVDMAHERATVEHDASVHAETIRKEIESLGEYRVSAV